MKKEESIYEYKMKVRDYECDAQGIVNNANYQHYYEVVRHEFLEQHGLNFYELHEEGIDAVVVSVYIRYRHSLRGANDFVCTVDSIEKDGIRYIFNQKITRLKDGKICSTARVETACMVNGKVGKPELFDNILGKYLK
ncbi:MAG: acyl-CoA thioesterase [Prevotella sp.]|jgi:acyl-CoA thioester hydrolase|nr:acyl-CoA thioesterase [Prevotella sp.]